MATGYKSVRTTLSDFTPGKDEVNGELEVKKGQTLLLLSMHTSRRGWWKFKIKSNRGESNSGSGLVSKANTQEAPFISSATACNDFCAEAIGDLTITEHEALSVYCVEGDWVLVKGTHAVGYVPRECIKLEEEMDQAVVLLDYEAAEPEELSLRKGEILIILDCENENWWRCKNGDREVGMVPRDNIEIRNNREEKPTLGESAREPTPGGKDNPISSSMGVSTIISYLVAHGCKDLSSSINPSSFGEYPVIKGGITDVHRGQFFDGTLIAMETIRPSSSDKNLKWAARELHTWSKCSHPNVLPLLGLASFRGTIGIISSWMGEGNLQQYLSRALGVNRYKLCSQVCEGLSYLHNIGIIHGDLNGSNVLISNEGIPCLSGFYISSLVNSTMSFTPTTSGPMMTVRWAAPELIAGESSCTESSDVYALGMTLYEIMTGKVPYKGMREFAVTRMVLIEKRVPDRPEGIPIGSPDADKQWELLLRCWSREPSSRPSAGEVVEAMAAVEALLGISRKLAAQEVVSRLVAHGCQDISQSLDLSSFSEFPISHGGNSDVYRGKLSDRREVAVKVLRVSMDSINQLGAKHLKASHAARELHTWNKCRHPNIAPLLGLAVFRDRIGMVAPWMKNGNLPRHLKNVPGVNRHNMCIQICEGLSYLHQKGIVHCDLKGANVLISDEGAPLLTDFGTSLVSDQTLHFTATTSGLSYTVRWSAAEILQQSGPHTKESDVYALGMTIYETFAGKVPYGEKKDISVMLQVIKKELPERPECMLFGDQRWDKLWELLVRCWSYEPEARPSADDVTETICCAVDEGLGLNFLEIATTTRLSGWLEKEIDVTCGFQD